MNNGDESEKESVNILSHNRDNHTRMMVLAPVLMMGGAFLILLLLVGGIVFFMVNRAGFLAFMPTVFTGAIELLKWLGVVLVSGLAIKFVFGSAIKDVFAPLIEILLRAWGELRKDRVVHANDNFMAYTGNIKISHHEEIRQNYNIKQIDGPAPVAGLLEAPKNQMYYARDLYERGELFKAITAGRIILGWGEKEGMRKLWMIPRASYFSTIAGGLPASGKCLGKDTPVMLFDGSVIPVQDVHVGDLLMGPDSQPRRVLSTNKGHGPLYRITPKRGMSWVCNDVHMVTVKDTHSHSAHRGQIKDIPLNEYLACHSNRLAGEKWKLFRVGVEFPDTSVDVDPYLVGLWLGDGTTDEVSFTSQDEQIIQYLVGAAPRYGMQAVVDTRKNCGNAQSIRFRLGTRQAMGGNHMGTDVPNILGCVLLKQCRNANGVKIIPNAYLKNSWEKRLQLLAGLIDTDGYYYNRDGSCSGGYEINTEHEHLADQIAFLAQSLGFAANVTPKPMRIEHSGEIKTYFRIYIAGHVSEIPCRIPDKQAHTRTSKRDVLATDWDAQPIGNGDYYGFTLDGDGRFLLGDFTVTHNTTTAYWVLVQQILIGAKIILIDPHMHYQSEDGSKSLTIELKPFENSYVFPPIDASSPAAIIQRVKWMKQTIDTRKRPGYVAKLSDIVILVIDEVNSVFELDEINKQLADDLSYIQREGRKFGVHTMLLGHRWSRDDIGKVNIRTVASTVMAHKQNDENQAGILVGKANVKQVLNLTPGSYLFRSVNAMIDDDGTQEYSLTRVQTPMMSAIDASWVLQLKQDVEAWLAHSEQHSDPASDNIPTRLPTNQQTQKFPEKGSYAQPPGKAPEVESDPDLPPELLSLMHKVMECEADGVRNQEEVIERVWGPEYTSGRKRQEVAIPQLMQIRKAIALQLARLRSNA